MAFKVLVNGITETVQLHRPGAEVVLQIDNSENLDVVPALILRDYNSTTEFRFSASESSLIIQTKTTSEDWEEAETLAEFSGESGEEGQEEGVFNEEYLSDLIDHLRLLRNSGVGVKFKEMITEYQLS